MQPDCILLLSGGIDSTTLLVELKDRGRVPMCLVFDYGQTLHREISIALENAEHFGAPLMRLYTPFDFLPEGAASILGNGAEIAAGRSREEIAAGGTPSSYVPFRNGVFLAYAVALGEAVGLADIYCGGNGLDSGNYWDDTYAFALAFTAAAEAGTNPGYHPKVHMPYSKLEKWQIVRTGVRLGLDYGRTWSCYKNGPTPCGACDSCVQRSYALEKGGAHA